MDTDTDSAVREPSRLAALQRTALLDSRPEEHFDRLTRLASRFLGAPVALVSLVAEDRQFFKSAVGLPEPWASRRATPLSHSFCKHVVASSEPLVIEDAREHPLAFESPAIQDLNVIAYLGTPLINSEGKILGTLCATDSKPRKWTEDDLEVLRDLAGAVMTEIELRTLVLELADELERRPPKHDTREPALEEQNTLIRTITDNATVAMFMMDVNGHPTFMNPAAAEMTGYTLDEIRHMPLHDAIHNKRPDGTPYPMSECPIDRALPENNDMRAHQDLFVRKDGSFFSVSVAARPILRDGRPTGTVVEVRDITEEKRAEEALRREEERYRSLVQATSSIVWNTTAAGELLGEQPGWSSFTGQSREAYEGWGWLEAVHPEDRKKTADAWNRALETRTPYGIEHRVRRHDGVYRHLLVRAVPILDENGQVREWVGVHTDVTERKEVEERQRLLSESGALLTSSLDYQTTLASVAWSAVPRLADWCAIDILGEDGAVQRVEVAHPDPAKRELALEIQRRYPANPNAAVGVPHVLRTGEPELVAEIPDELLELVARDATHLRMMRELGLRSYIVVPMIARGRTVGAISLISAESGRRYGPADLETAQELALRSAFAVDNARLFTGMERLVGEVENERGRLRQVFAEAPAVMALYSGPEHVVTLVNPTWEQTVGKPNAVGKPFREVFPEFGESGLFELLDRVYETGEAYVDPEVNVPLERWGNGVLEDTYWSLVWKPLAGTGPGGRDILVHAVEVTEQVRARQQVEQLEERLRLALEAADVGTYDWDTSGTTLNWDSRARRIFDVPETGEVTFETFAERVHPEDRERTNRAIEEALHPEGRSEFATEYRVVWRDGSLHWVRALGRVYFNGEGADRHAVRFLGTVQDVTEQHQLQQQIETERGRLREVFQQAPALIAVLRGPQHVFEIANPPYLALMGRRNVLGKPIREAIPEVEGQGYFEMLDGVYQSGTPVVGNEMHAVLDRTGDGRLEEGFFNFVFHPLREADGKVDGILIHAVEVTEQVRVRQEVERKAAELARTASALEASNRELDQFAYVASHDLKAPLRGIANLSQWIEEDIADALSDENRQQMNLLRGRVHRMEALIDGILEYSRAGRMTSRPEHVDTAALVREVVELLDPPDNFTIQVADELPTLETERLPLQQVFMNLLGNAIKYTDRPDARVEVTARDAGDFVEFGVADNGPGIAPEYHEKIFAIFQRLEARDQVEGTGIGLSLVKKIVEGRRGRVWIESEEGQGTTFRFTWPKVPEGAF